MTNTKGLGKMSGKHLVRAELAAGIAKLLLIGVLTAANAVQSGPVVSGGVPTDEAFADPAAWKVQGGEFVGRGGGEMLYSRSLYPGDVTVEAELALGKVAGTAASLSVQGVNWGFDGGRARRPFVESLLVSKDLGSGGIAVEQDRFFTVRVESRGGRQKTENDGSPAGIVVVHMRGVGPAFVSPPQNRHHQTDGDIDGDRHTEEMFRRGKHGLLV